MPIRLSKSSLDEQEFLAVKKVLEKEYLGMGPEVDLFESELADYLNLPKATITLVNSGTSALQLALEALDIGPGHEVLVPSLTYVASCQAILATGAKPVLCDVNPRTLFIDVDDMTRRLSDKTRAVMPVHYASSAEGISEVHRFARQHNLRVIEDAAHSFGSTIDNNLVGQSGDIVCFSFDGIKNITSGEGGAIICHDPALLDRLKDGRLLGVEKDSEKRIVGERSWDFDVKHRGFRFHMSDIMAAIGRVQLTKITATILKRHQLVEQYLKGLASIIGADALELRYDSLAPHIFVVKIAAEKRDGVMQHLQSVGIGCGVHYKPNHLLSLFNTDYSLPVTEGLYEEILSLPLHTGLSEQDVAEVLAQLKFALSASRTLQ